MRGTKNVKLGPLVCLLTAAAFPLEKSDEGAIGEASPRDYQTKNLQQVAHLLGETCGPVFRREGADFEAQRTL